MTDVDGWAAPGAGQDEPRWGERLPPAPDQQHGQQQPPAQSAPYGQPVPHGQPSPYGQQTPSGQQPPWAGHQPPWAAQQPPAPGPPPGWTPPPRPGLLALRPFTFGEVLTGSFQVFRRNPRTTFGTALLAQVVLLVVTLGVTGGTAAAAFSRVDSALPQDRDAVAAGAVAVTLLSTIVPLLLSVVVSALLQGLFVLETSRQLLGQRLRLGGLWALTAGRRGALLGWSALLTLAYLVGVAVVAGVVALGFVVGGGTGIAIGIVSGLLAGLGALAVGVWLSVQLSLVPSALMLERLTLGAAVSRSWRLVRGSFWRTFGVVVLVLVMIQVAAQVASTPISLLAALLAGALAPTGDVTSPTFLVVTGAGYLLTFVVAAVVASIGSVVQAASTALVYVDRRIRTEGLDLELVRHVERRDAGQADLPDPWRSPWGDAAPPR
jgi:hypothetical protein